MDIHLNHKNLYLIYHWDYLYYYLQDLHHIYHYLLPQHMISELPHNSKAIWLFNILKIQIQYI